MGARQMISEVRRNSDGEEREKLSDLGKQSMSKGRTEK